MILKHWENPLHLTRIQRQRLVNIFWKNHKLKPCNNTHHPNFERIKNFEDDSTSDITDIDFDRALTTHLSAGSNHEVRIIGCIAPFFLHSDKGAIPRWNYVLIIYNEGCLISGKTQTDAELGIQKEGDVLLLDTDAFHEVKQDVRAFKRLPVSGGKQLDNLLVILALQCYSKIRSEEEMVFAYKELIYNILD